MATIRKRFNKMASADNWNKNYKSKNKKNSKKVTSLNVRVLNKIMKNYKSYEKSIQQL